jgi:hypothetical protein
MPHPTPPNFPSLPPSRQALLNQLTQAAIGLWGEERADALSKLLEEHAQRLMDLSSVMPPNGETPTMGWQNHP